MAYHVRVTPLPDEPLVLERAEAEAGLAWLHAHLDNGTLSACKAFPQTGGYMDVEVDTLADLWALLGTYPLRHTVAYDVYPLTATLDDGFAVLFEAIAARQRIAAPTP